MPKPVTRKIAYPAAGRKIRCLRCVISCRLPSCRHSEDRSGRPLTGPRGSPGYGRSVSRSRRSFRRSSYDSATFVVGHVTIAYGQATISAFRLRKGSCLAECLCMWHKARHGNEKQVRKAFEDFRGQDPRDRPLLRRRALQAATLSGLNRNTRLALRERILLACDVQRPLVVETDESFARQDRRGRRARPSSSVSVRAKSEIVPDCPTLPHPGPGEPPHRHQLRWLARLRRLGRPQLWPLPCRSFQGRVHQGDRPRHRGLPGPGLTDEGGPVQTHLPSPPQGNRMAPSPCRQIPNPTTIPKPKPAQLGMTLRKLSVLPNLPPHLSANYQSGTTSDASSPKLKRT